MSKTKWALPASPYSSNPPPVMPPPTVPAPVPGARKYSLNLSHSAPSSAAYIYVPLPLHLVPPPSTSSQIGTHAFLFSGGAFDTTRLIESWHVLVQRWPVLAAQLVRSDKVPAEQRQRRAAPAAVPGAKVEVRRVDDRDALYYRIPSADSLKAQALTEPSGAAERLAQPVRPGSSAKALSSARRRLLPSLLCLRAIDGLSIRTALPFQSTQDLSPSKISTFPSLDDVHIQRGHYAQNAPRSLAELLRALPGVGGPHRPMLSVQITIFEDGLLVLMSAPAFFLDAAGAREVMRAWSTILHEGGAAPVPHLRGTVENTLLSALLADPTPVPLTNAKPVPPYGFMRYAWSWRLLLSLREAWERLVAHRPGLLEAREIWVPEGVVRELMAQARKDLLDEGHEPDEEEGRVEREHVLLAWLLQSMNRGKEKRAKLVSVLAPMRLSALARSHSSAEKGEGFPAHEQDGLIDHRQGESSVGAAASFPTVPISQVPYATLLVVRLGILALRIRYAQEAQTACPPAAAVGADVSGRGSTAITGAAALRFHLDIAAPPVGRKRGRGGGGPVHFFGPAGNRITFDDRFGALSANFGNGETGGEADAEKASGKQHETDAAPPSNATGVPLPIKFSGAFKDPKGNADKPEQSASSSTAAAMTATSGALLHSFSYYGRPSRERRNGSMSLPAAIPLLPPHDNGNSSGMDEPVQPQTPVTPVTPRTPHTATTATTAVPATPTRSAPSTLPVAGYLSAGVLSKKAWRNKSGFGAGAVLDL